MSLENFTIKKTGKKSLSSAPFQASSIVIVILLSFIGAYWAYDEYSKYHDNLAFIQERYLEESRKRLQDEVRSLKQLIVYRESQIGRDTEKELRNQVHSAYTTAAHLYSLYQDQFPEKVLKETIVEALRPIRWNTGKGYYFIGDTKQRNIVLHSSNPEFENMPLESAELLNDNLTAFKEISEKRGAGFYRYLNTKPGEGDDLFPKLGFIKYFKPYNWFIGTGVYLDEMLGRTQDAVLKRMEEIRFGNNGYFICIDKNGNTIADLEPLRKGRSISQLLDIKNESYGDKLYEIGTKGIKNGFFTYELEGENETSVLRLSHIIYYEPWDWVIVASVELVEMQKAIGFEVNRYKELIIRGAILYVILAIITIGIIFIIASYHSNRIREGVELFTNFFRDTADQKISAEERAFVFEEFDVLGQYANRMVEEREEQELLIQTNERRLDTLLELSRMSGENSKKLANFALSRLLEITKSEYGYISLYDENDDELHCISIYGQNKNIELPSPLKVSGESSPAKCYRAGREIIDNYPVADLKNSVYPKDLKITKFLDVPCYEKTKITMIAGVCNKNDLYNEHDVRQVSLLLEGVWRILLKTRAEREMRDLRVMLRTVYDSMPSALIVVDAEYKIISWNTVASKYSDSGVEFGIKKQLVEIFPRLKMIPDVVDEVIKTNSTIEKRNVPYSLDEQTLHETITVYPLQSEGVSGAVIRLDDVTEKVKIETLVAQSEKMLSVGGLAAGMAHEINNPLAGIVQNLQVIRNRFSSEFTKNHRLAEECRMTVEDLQCYIDKRGVNDLFEAIEDSTKRAVKLVKNMLSFSRKGNTLYGFGDICEITDNALSLALSDYDINQNIDVNKINVTKDYSADLPMVSCERTNIQQVIFNILSNGLYALSSRVGSAREPEINIRIYKDEKWMVVEIEDNGPGMDAKTVKRVFEPFYTTKPDDIGTGLGLSISYFIINEQHSGNLEVRSTLGRGTQFSIRLPLKREKKLSDND